jgi:hypothetical protein
MKCKISITAKTDLAAWVSRKGFMDNVDSADLSCRESEVIYDWYHPDWFRNDDNGELYFIPPAFGFWGGHIRGINGRHRAILLFRHLEAIPMLIVLPGAWPKQTLAEIMQREIREHEIIELPNLPVNVGIKEPGEQGVPPDRLRSR